MNLLDAWGNLSVLVATATDGAISRANGDFIAIEGILRGHNSLVNHALAGTCVPYTKEVQSGNLALGGQSFLFGFAHLLGGIRGLRECFTLVDVTKSVAEHVVGQ